jgi:peptidoglycan-N-acetylglucosamine deacetylase
MVKNSSNVVYKNLCPMIKKNVYLTFDIEPFWVNIPVRHHKDDWKKLRDQSAKGFYEILEICAELNLKATFFFVGEWARQYPKAVSAAKSMGHTIGSHSHFHEDLTKLSAEQLRSDLATSKKILEDIVGQKIVHFRAPSFSLLPEQMSVVREAGFLIDSSTSNASRVFGGSNKLNFRLENFASITQSGLKIFGKEITILGGGYLRIIPPKILRLLVHHDLGNMIYLHPVDFCQSVPYYSFLSWSENLRKKIRVGDMRKKIQILNEAYNLCPLPDLPIYAH